jgi:hypothetical protein
MHTRNTTNHGIVVFWSSGGDSLSEFRVWVLCNILQVFSLRLFRLLTLDFSRVAMVARCSISDREKNKKINLKDYLSLRSLLLRSFFLAFFIKIINTRTKIAIKSVKSSAL